MPRTSSKPDVIIVGGGVIGCAIAYYVARTGMQVLVIDPFTKVAQASQVAAGLVAPSPQLTNPSPFATIAIASVKRLPNLRDELHEESGIDIGFQRCGTLRIATSEHQAETQRKRLPKQRALGLNLEWLTNDEVLWLEPALTSNICGAIYGPDEGLLNAKNLHSAYMASAKARGAKFEKGRVTGLLTTKAQVTGVKVGQMRISAKHVVLASGAWTPQAAKWLGISLPITPERGQILTISHAAPSLSHIVFGEQIYLSPQKGQQITVGASKDQCGYDRRTTVAGISMLLDKCVKIAPTYANATLKTAKAGLRPRTSDGCPIIGPIPDWAGISIAAGHNSNGLLLSEITGRIIASQLTGEQPPIDVSPYEVGRFADHPL